jgi:hypothetical protein
VLHGESSEVRRGSRDPAGRPTDGLLELALCSTGSFAFGLRSATPNWCVSKGNTFEFSRASGYEAYRELS